MEYDVYAYHAVSDDGSCNGGCSYHDNDQVSAAAASVPYETVVSVSAVTGTHEYGGTQSRTAVSACTKVRVWVDTDQDDPVWITGTF